MSHASRTVVFDFDGVLVAHDSTGELVRQRLTAHPARLIAALPAVLLLALGRFSPTIHRRASRYLIRLADLGRDEAAEEAVAAFGRSLAHRSGWPVRGAINAVRAHLEAGDRVLVASASLEGCVRAYLDEVGLSEVTVLASRLGPDGSLAMHNYHGEKVRSAQRSGWTAPWARVYSDSIRDAPMFAVAQQVTLVNVDDRTRVRVAEQVAPEVVVDTVSWS